MRPVAPKRCARVLAGRLLAKRLPARTRAHRWAHNFQRPIACTPNEQSRRDPMKPITFRLISIALLGAFSVAPAYAQNARLQINHLDRLFPQAVETIDVRVDGGLLLMASKFLRSDKADEAAVKEIVRDLKGVYVKGVEFDKEGEFTAADVEEIRQQLAGPGWDRIVGVRSKRDGENVEVFLMIK